LSVGRLKSASKREEAKKKKRIGVVDNDDVIKRITLIFILCSLFIDYSRKVNTLKRKKKKKRARVSVCVFEWMKVKFERDVARILCKKHNIRTERCDCEHRAVLAGQQYKCYYNISLSFNVFYKKYKAQKLHWQDITKRYSTALFGIGCHSKQLHTDCLFTVSVFNIISGR
jgi:hypothetical protein